VPTLEQDFGADAAAFLAQLLGGGRTWSATVARRERGLGAKERHPRKAADKLHLVLRGAAPASEGGGGGGEGAKVDVAREMLLEGLARLPKAHKVRRWWRSGPGAAGCVRVRQRRRSPATHPTAGRKPQHAACPTAPTDTHTRAHTHAQVRDPALKAAIEALADAEDEARRAHRGIWEHGDPGDSEDEEPPRPPQGAWGAKKR
jgi:endonuclease YncB( thermonuclease family)